MDLNVARQVDNAEARHFTSDCPMAAEQIAAVAESGAQATHPIELLRQAYGTADTAELEPASLAVVVDTELARASMDVAR